MPDKKISQLPLGVVTPESLFPVISNGATTQITFNDILIQASSNDKFITAGTYNQIVGMSTFYFNDGTSYDITGYFTGYTYTPENIANKQNSMIFDGGGIKYPSVDAVNELTNDIALATINTGFIDPNDSFIMTRLDDFTLALSASNKGIIFKSLLETPPFALDTAILNIPETILDLNSIGLTLNGVYIIYIGYTGNGNLSLSNNNFNTLNNTTQLGILILKVSGGTTSFLDSNRGIINMPTIAAYSNLEKTILGLQSNVIVIPNDGTMTVSNTAGSLKGMSVNWHGANNDEKLIASSTGTSFTHLSYGNALTPTPAPFISAVTTDQYWDNNLQMLVNLSTSGAASIQRWIVTINGNLALQYGEQEYSTLEEALDNVGTATFIDVIPQDTYFELSRMVAISGTTDVGNTQQCVFRVTDGVGSGGDTVETVWGEISGNIHDQTDLFNTFEPNINAPFIDIGDSQSPTTTVNLVLGRNLKVNVVGNTLLNIVPSTEGNESDLVLTVPGGVIPTLTFSPNVIWHNNNIPTIANPDGGLDPSFVVVGPAPGNTVSSVIQQPDGKLVLVGYFTTYNGISNSLRIARLNSDGSRDLTFSAGTGAGTGFNANVYNITQQLDGKLLIGGAFTTYRSVASNRIVRLDSNGVNDGTFTGATAGFNNTVYSMLLQSDNKILVGGDFTAFSGITANRITRLNTDGTLDTTFSGVNTINSYINSIAIQSDNKIVVTGLFTGTSENAITRLNADGTKDLSFNVGNGFDSYGQSVILQADGKIVVGGFFNAYNPIFANRFIKLNFDGSIDNSFNIGTGFNYTTITVAQQPDGKVLVGGSFTTYNNSLNINRIVRINTNGTIDNTFNNGVGSTAGFNNSVNTIVVQPDNKILVSGSFTTYTGATQNYLIRLNSNGSKDASFSGLSPTAFNTNVNTLALQPDGKILCGGQFTTYTGGSQNYIVRLNSDGSRDTSFSLTGTALNGFVTFMELQSDNKIVVIGQFTTVTGTSQNYITRLNTDGSRDTSFNIGAGFNSNAVYCMKIQSDDKIVVGGFFTQYNGTTTPKIVRINNNGNLDTTFNAGAGFNFSVIRIMQQSDGKLVFTGDFTYYNNISSVRMVRTNLDGSMDTSFNIGGGFNAITNMSLQSSGETKLFATGNYTSYSGVPVNKIARLNTDGSLDTTFNSGGTGFDFIIYHLKLQGDKILVSGNYNKFNDITATRFIRLNADGTRDTSFTTAGTGFQNAVSFSMLQSDGKIIVTGLFTSYNAIPQYGISRLKPSIEVDYYFKLLQDGSNIIIK